MAAAKVYDFSKSTDDGLKSIIAQVKATIVKLSSASDSDPADVAENKNYLSQAQAEYDKRHPFKKWIPYAIGLGLFGIPLVLYIRKK